MDFLGTSPICLEATGEADRWRNNRVDWQTSPILPAQ